MIPIKSIGTVQTMFGVLEVFATRYPRGGAIAIFLQDHDGEQVGVFSTNLVPYGAVVDCDCFTAKTWSENEPLVLPMLETGLFEDTGRAVATGFCSAPIWRLRDPDNVPAELSTAGAADQGETP